ncbi:MAG: peptidoglycan-binding protein [Lamprocystis purpurea]|jgi:hypothetical protein|uniref:peptidoglycan-binding protein n=1 Tax=Lamprocystis purpurea TaxID=61598 RepID=UPI000367E91D|nr:peptidoglycan-binding protein [Lamprocystis purpurea]MBV5275434.1 peptidoglycan-binding protein [Lamprocystis purpurea]
MYDRNSGAVIVRTILLCTCAWLLLTVRPVLAQPARIGLVIGNSAYASFPALPTCMVSSRELATALRGQGFQVIERQDVTSGGLAAAIDEFNRAMAAAPDASVFVYVCGYTAGMNDRPFLLPVSATIQRPTDVMTQGVLAKVLSDMLVRGQPSRGVLALDLMPAVGVTAPVLETLNALSVPPGVGLIAATTPLPTAEPTALAVVLAAGLNAPDLQSGALLTAAEGKLRDHPGTVMAALRLPSVSRPLAADDPPPSVPPAFMPAGAEPAVPDQFPNEGAMSDNDRRRVQEGLARLGYYGAAIDGRFGPETRAAIRRFQHELGVAMTGTITGEQAARLFIRN